VFSSCLISFRRTSPTWPPKSPASKKLSHQEFRIGTWICVCIFGRRKHSVPRRPRAPHLGQIY
jgi:hypothetical protein